MTGRECLNRVFSGILPAIFILSVPLFTACKKRTAFNSENAQESIDSGTFRAEGDAVITDINNAVSDQFLLRGKGVSVSEELGLAGNAICGVSLDTSKVGGGKITLVYNGGNCGNRIRSGQVMVTILDFPYKKWKQKTCTLKVDFADFKVAGVNDGRSMTVNGTFYLTNESGGTWYDMKYLNVPSVVQTVTGNDIKLTFDGVDIVTINIKRRYTYSINGDVISCSEEGLGEQDSKSSLESWGESRQGKEFTSQVVTPYVWRTSCGAYIADQGEVKVNVAGKYFELTSYYGLDSNGDGYTGTGCANSWKVTWSYKKKTNKRIFSYSR